MSDPFLFQSTFHVETLAEPGPGPDRQPEVKGGGALLEMPEGLAQVWAQNGVGPPRALGALDLALVRVPGCLKISPKPLQPET